MAQNGVVAAAVFAGLFLLIVLALFIFMIQRHLHRPARPRHSYQTLADGPRRSRHQDFRTDLEHSHSIDKVRSNEAIEANLTTADFVIDAPVAHPAPLDLRYSCDGANASYITPAKCESGNTATGATPSPTIAEPTANQEGHRTRKRAQNQAPSPAKSVRESAMVRAALHASMLDLSVPYSFAQAGPSGLTARERLADARAAVTTHAAHKTVHSYDRWTTESMDVLYRRTRHGRFDWKHEQTAVGALTTQTIPQQQDLSILEADLGEHSRVNMSRHDLPSQRERFVRHSTLLAQQEADLGLFVPNTATFDVC